MVTGGCLCAGVQIQITGTLNKIQICHCRQCRKAQGTPFASNIPVAKSNLTILKGRDLLQEYESTTREGKHRIFCRTCGSPIFSRLDSLPDIVRIRAGLLDEPVKSNISHHQFVAQKASWWEIIDDTPRHEEIPPE